MANEQQRIEQSYALAREQYAAIGVDVEQAIKRLAEVAISLHCWQGDDVGGFERVADELGGGLAVTGNYPGKARTPDELRGDFDTALSLIPGRHRFNLHASYAETGGQRVERNELTTAHFQGWIDWARATAVGDRLQSHLLRSSPSGRRLYAHACRRGNPPVLDRTWDRLPENRRGHRPGPGKNLRHQCLDPGRNEGRHRRSQRSA